MRSPTAVTVLVIAALTTGVGTAMAQPFSDHHPVVFVGVGEDEAKSLIQAEQNDLLLSVDAYRPWSGAWFPNHNGHWITNVGDQWTCREKVDDLELRLDGAIDQLSFSPDYAVVALRAIIHDYACEDLRLSAVRANLARAFVHLGIGLIMEAGAPIGGEELDAFTAALSLNPNAQCPPDLCAYMDGAPEQSQFDLARSQLQDEAIQAMTGGILSPGNLENALLNDAASWRVQPGVNLLAWTEDGRPEQHMFLVRHGSLGDSQVITRKDWKEKLIVEKPSMVDDPFGNLVRETFATRTFPNADRVTFLVVNEDGPLIWTFFPKSEVEKHLIIADHRQKQDEPEEPRQPRTIPPRTESQIQFGPTARLTGKPKAGPWASTYLGPSVGGRIAIVVGLQLSLNANVLFSSDTDGDLVVVPYGTLGAGYRLPIASVATSTGAPLRIHAWFGGEALIGVGGVIGESLRPTISGHGIAEIQIGWIAVQGRIGGGQAGLDGGVSILLQIPFKKKELPGEGS